MKKLSKALIAFTLTLSLVLLSSCGKDDKGNDDEGVNGGKPVLPPIINTEGGVEGPIIPYD